MRRKSRDQVMKKLSLTYLPENYDPLMRIALQKDKKLALFLNLGALLIAVLMFILGHFIVPIAEFLELENFWEYLLRYVVLIAALVAYIFLHELAHGVCMKCFGAVKVKYGFTGLYAYAGSESYFYKIPYIIIALAPVVLWGVVLLMLNCAAGTYWFWNIYFIQISNISGAAGDLYVIYSFSKLPRDILIQDTGVSMTVYSRRNIDRNKGF